MPDIYCDDEADEAIICRSGNAFTPLQVSAVVGWLRVGQATVDGSEGVSSLPNVMGGSPMVQGTGSRRPIRAAAGNGLPIMQFVSNDFLIEPLQSGVNNNAAWFGMGMWLRSPIGTTIRTIYAIVNDANSATATRLRWQVLANESMAFDAFLDDSNARRLASNASQVAGGWEFWTVAHDGSLSGDARAVQHNGGASPGAAYSAIGTATEMPATLVTPTGNALLGTGAALANPFIGDMGPNIYFFNRQLTAPELANLMAFEQPVG